MSTNQPLHWCSIQGGNTIESETKALSRLLYLVCLAVSLFILNEAWAILVLFVIQAFLWIHSGLPLGLLRHALRRLSVFFLIIIVSYALLPLDNGQSRWLDIPLLPGDIKVNLSGMSVALIMCLRVATLVLASSWVQNSTSPQMFVQSMKQLQVPEFLALAVATTLALLSAEPGKGSRGSGKHGHDGRKGKRKAKVQVLFKQIRAGNIDFLRDLVSRSLQRTEDYLRTINPEISAQQARDLAVVSGIALAIMGLKLIQLLPGLPVAPGHKNLVMIPLFLLAARLTQTRFGGFWTGCTVGTLSFMLGFGKYGILEIFQFIIPGLLADLLLPLASGSSRILLMLQFGMIGAVMGLARFAANIAVIFLAGAPPAAFVIYLPMLASQVVFGIVSALVSTLLLDKQNKQWVYQSSGKDQAEADRTRPQKNQRRNSNV